MKNPPALVVGLGNPGVGYEPTRHNAGFWFVESLATKLATSFAAKKNMHGDLAATADCRLLRPTTFMNNSGRAVLAAAAYYKIPPAEILIVHDEADLLPGVARLKFGGGSGGHNGIADINRVLGKEYWRLRLGVGNTSGDIADYVLARPPVAERDAIDSAISEVLQQWNLIASGDWQKAMLVLHSAANANS